MTVSMERRAFIVGVGTAGAGLALSGCSGHPGSATSTYAGDFRTVALAAALENQAVALYRALLAGSPTRKLALLAQACLKQHAEHAMAWNAILRSAHKPAISGVPLAGHSLLMAEVRSASALSSAAALAFRLENQAAQTYVAAAGSLTIAVGVAAAASIAPVEAMHAATLRFVMGDYPTPTSFMGLAAAARVTELTA